MNYEDILKSKYFIESYKKIEKIKENFSVNHGFVHIDNVIGNAKKLVEVFGLSENEEKLLLIACCLHDLGYLNGREDHAISGAVLAREYLENQGFDDAEISVICNAIRNHGGKKIEDYFDKISMCLVVADKLDFVSSRYNENLLENDKKIIFLNIIDTCIEYGKDVLVLKIKVNENFNVEMFEKSNYFYKLKSFLDLLCERLLCEYEIKYNLFIENNFVYKKQ